MFPRLLIVAGLVSAVDDIKPLTPVEARERVGKVITVEMTVTMAKDRLERRGEIYLDAEADFKDVRNFAVVVTRAGAASLKAAGVHDPAARYMSETIRATGTVKEVDGVPRIEIDAASRIRVVGPK